MSNENASSGDHLPNLNPRLSPNKNALGQKLGLRKTHKNQTIRDSANVVAKTTEARRRVLEVYEYEIRPQLREKSVVSDGVTAKEAYLPESPDSEEALTHLVQELVFLFIATFHQDSMSSWRILLETLLHIQPVCRSLQEYPQIEHYLRRVRYHASARVEKTFMMRVLDIVAKLFPDVAGPNVTVENTLKLAGSPRRNISLRNSPTRRGAPKDSSSDINDKGAVSKSPTRYSVKDLSNRITTNQGLPLTGKDAVEYFRKPEQASSCKIFYLIERSRPQLDPYDLVVVPKTKVVQNPQPYYMVTKSEVVFLDENGASERFTHSEWLRDAENFHLILSLPTFKHFLLREAFNRWRHYSCVVHEQRWKRELTNNLLLASPPLVLPLQFMMRALSSISELQIIRLNADEDPTIYIQQKCLTLRPTLSRALMEVQSSLAMARSQVLASFDTYRKFRKHPALRKLKQSLYLSKEDSTRRKHLLQLACKVERMHNLAYHKTASHVSELLEKSFTAAQHGPPFSCTLALRKGIDSSENDLRERIFLEADLSRLREKLSGVVQTLTHAVAETLVECEIRNKHNLMFGGIESQSSPNIPILLSTSGAETSANGSSIPAASSSSVTVDASEVDLPECFTTYHSFMSRLAKQISGSHVVKKNLKLIDEKLDAATRYVDKFIEESSLKSMVRFLESTDIDQLKKILNSDQSQEIIDKISEWNYFLNSKLPDTLVTRPPVLIVSCRSVREKLSAQLSVFLSRITDNAKLFVIQKSIPLNRTLSDILQDLKWNENCSWSEHIDFFYKYNESLDSSFLLKKEIQTLETYFSVLCCLQSDLPEDVDKIHRDIHFLWHSTVYTLRRCKSFLENNRESALTAMEVAYKAAMNELNVCLAEVSDGVFVTPTSNAEEIRELYSQISAKFVDSLTACDKIAKWKTGTPGVKINVPNTELLNQKFVSRGDLWNQYAQTEEMNAKWLTMNLTNELFTDVEFNVQKWHSMADNLCQYLPDHDPVLVAWQSKVDHWKKLLPLLRDLLTSVKDQNDWTMILNGLGATNESSVLKSTPSIGYLSEVGGFTSHGEWVDRVCQLLARREKVEDLIAEIVHFWLTSRFIPSRNVETELYNQNGRSSSGNRLRTGRDSHGQASNPSRPEFGIMNLSTFLTKVKEDSLRLETYRDLVFRETRIKINWCLSLLTSLNQMLKICHDYQSKFQLLRKYLPLIKPKDDDFTFVSRSYQMVIEWLANHSFPICHVSIPSVFNNPDYLSSWLEVHGDIDHHRVCHLTGNYTLVAKITSLSLEQESLLQKLDEFLNNDMANFPRLFLLSETERREFYAQNAQNFYLVYDSPYLRRCFPAINKVTVSKDTYANTWMLRLHSDGESFDIPEAPCTAATLSHWLSSLQVATCRYLRRTIREGANELYDTSDFNKFVTGAIESESYPVQTVLVIGGLWWTDKLTDSLENHQILEELNLKLNEARLYLVGKIKQFRGQSASRTSLYKVEGLLYQVDYYRNLLEGIVGQKRNNPKDFKWKSALRLNSIKSSSHLIEDVSISISDIIQNYGYSYVGPSVAYSFAPPLLEKSAVLLAIDLKRGKMWPKFLTHSRFPRDLITNTAKILGVTCFVLSSTNDKEYLERFTRYLTATMMDGSWLVLESTRGTPSREDYESVRSHLKHISRCLDIHDLRSKNDAATNSNQILLDFNGRTLSVHPNFILSVITPEDNEQIDKDLNRLRLIEVCEPDWKMVVEARLRASGFSTDVERFSQSICDILRTYRDEIVPNTSFISQIRTFIKLTRQTSLEILKETAPSALTSLTSVEKEEERALSMVLVRHFLSNISDESSRAKYDSLLKEAFPSAKIDGQLNEGSNIDWLLRTRIKEAMSEMRLEANTTLIDKCVELYEVLMHNRLVLLSGPPSSGKTFCCRVLVRVLRNYEDEIGRDTPKINFQHIFPGAWRQTDFERWLLEYKSTRWKPETEEFNGGSNIIPEREWLLVDGESEHCWYNSAAFTEFRDDFSRCDKGCLILEMSDSIIARDPSFFDNWTMVYFGHYGLDWTSLVDGFLSQLPILNPVSLAEVEKLRSWLYQLIPKASQFNTSLSGDVKPRDFQVSSFLRVYEAVLHHFYHPEDDNDTPKESSNLSTEDERLSGPLIYSLLWGYAGSIQFQCQKDRWEFEIRFRQCLSVCSPSLEPFLPKDEYSINNYSLFDYHLVPLTGRWERLTNMLTLDVRGKLKSTSSNNSNYVGEGLTAGVRSIVSILRRSKIATLITGGNGVGKTALLKFIHCDEIERKIHCRFLGASSGTIAEDFNLVFGKKTGTKDDEEPSTENDWSLIIDDAHLAGKSNPEPGESDPREWIRSIVSDPGARLTLSAVSEDTWSPRLGRQLVQIRLPPPDVNLLTSCYGKALDTWLTPSTRGYALLAALSVTQALIEATVEFHHSFVGEILESSKYLFSYQHVHRVFKKLVSIDAVSENSSSVSIPAIWCLVVECVYGSTASVDRDWNDRLWSVIKNMAVSKFTESRTPGLYPHPNSPGANVYVSKDWKNSSSNNEDFEKSLDLTRENFVLVPDVYSKRILLKLTTSGNQIGPLGNSLLPSQRAIVSGLTRCLVFPDGHAILTSEDRWVGKEICAIGVAKLLGCHAVTINYPADHLDEPEDQLVTDSLLEQCSDVLYWDNLWKTSPRTRTATKSGRLPPIRTKESPTKAYPPSKSGIPVLIGTNKEKKKYGKELKTNRKLIEKDSKEPERKDETSMVSKLQECLHKAGVKGDPVLLIVNVSSMDRNDRVLYWLLDTVQSLIIHGDCHWLRILRNSDDVMHYMQLLFLSERERDRNCLYSRFVSRVRKNLKVLVCAQTKVVSKILEFFPFTSSINGLISMDSWNREDWAQYAKVFGQNWQNSNEVWFDCLINIHREMVSKIGGYVHPSHLERAFYWSLYLRSYFDDSINEESAWRKGLDELSVVRTTLNGLEKQLEPLQERHRQVEVKLESCEDAIVACEEEYAMLQEHCTTFEEDLRHYKEQLEAQTETRRLLRDCQPVYQSALNQLLMLIPSRLQELKSYRAPPPAVTKVLGAFCLLFKIPQNFDSAKQYIMSEYLPALLQQFNWESVPEDVYSELGKLVEEPSLSVDLVAQSSEAAAALWRWIRAVHNFLQIKYTHKELYGEMVESRSLIKEREDALKRDRSTLEAVENELNSRRQELQESETVRSEIGEKINELQQEAEVFRQLLYAVRWAEDRWTAQALKKESPSTESVLLFVTNLVYRGLSRNDDEYLFEKELNIILNEFGLNPAKPNSVTDFFLSFDVQSFLMTEGVPADPESLSSLLSLTLHLKGQGRCPWNCVLLRDPYDYSSKWIQLAWDLISKQDNNASGDLNLASFYGDDPELLESIKEMDSSHGTVVLIKDVEYLNPDKLESMVKSTSNRILLSTKLDYESLDEFPKVFYQLPVLEIGCTGSKGLVEVLTHKLLQARHPNLFRQIRELEDLKSIRCQEAERAEEEIIASMGNGTWTLERLEEISKRQDQIAIRVSKLETETELELAPHKEAAGRIVLLAQKVFPDVVNQLPGLHLPPTWIYNSACDTRFDDDFEGKPNANSNAVASQRHFWAVFRNLCEFLDPPRMEELVYQLAVEIAKDIGQIGHEDARALIHTHYKLQSVNADDKPSWLTNQEWNSINSLVSVFPDKFVEDLKKSVSSEGGQDLWKPYRDEPFSPTTFPPLKLNEQLSLTQNALLKSALCSKQSSQIRWTLSIAFMGSIVEQCRQYLISGATKSSLKTFVRDKNPSLVILYFDGKRCEEIGNPTDEIVSIQHDADIMVFSCKTGLKWGATLQSAIEKTTVEGLWLIIEEPGRLSWTPKLITAIRNSLKNGDSDFKIWFLIDINRESFLPAFLDAYPKVMF